MVYHWLTHQMYWTLCQYQIHDTQLDVLWDVTLLYREFSPSAKLPYETDPGMFHHMLELFDQEQLLSQVEMKCSDIIARHCYCIYHTDYPMKFGESHKFMSFSKYKVLHEDNLPVGEVTTQARLHQGYIDSSIMRVIDEIHGLVTPYSPGILFQEERLSNIY